MTDKIILDIRHSDDYTDYLFQTAALANSHVVPLVDPGRDEMAPHRGRDTCILQCTGVAGEDPDDTDPVVFDRKGMSVRVRTRHYLRDDGAVDPLQADRTRSLVGEVISELLLSPENLSDAYFHYFPLLWRHRDLIASTQEYFFVRTGWVRVSDWDCYPLGVILKTIEAERRNFRLSLRGGCACPGSPLLAGYTYAYGEGYRMTLHTMCPMCGDRREIRTERFLREGRCNSALERICRYYDKGQGFSALSLFDLVDRLRSV